MASRFRPELQGLRAIAVAAVVAYHVWPDVVPGGYVGVDVFFVLSGFLITGILLRELEETGRINLPRFLARRAKRLLPAATVVLLAVLGAGFLFMPPTRWMALAREAIASALYVQNWLLVQTAVDYQAMGQAQSPLVHYWSLSVEEQFYIVWPALLAALGVWTFRRGGRRVVPSARVLLMGIVVVGLVGSIALTYAQPVAAYFSTLSRVWQLAFGGLLATLVTDGLPDRTRILLQWVGVAGIATAALTYGTDTLYPGFAAILPTVATGALIVGGSPAGRSSLYPALAARPMQRVGDLSYSIYLWHWPLVIFHSLLTWEAPGLVGGVAIVCMTLLLSALTRKWVELPIQHWVPTRGPVWKPIAMGATCILVVLLTAGPRLLDMRDAERSLMAAASLPGATTVAWASSPQSLGEDWDQVVMTGYRGDSSFQPAAVHAALDRGLPYVNGCHAQGRTTDARVQSNLPDCRFGDPGSGIHVVLVGDSHAAQWGAALVDIANARPGFRLTIVTKTSCPFSRAEVIHTTRRSPYSECVAWNRSVEEFLLEEVPALVVVSGSHLHDVSGANGRSAATARLLDGYREQWQPLLNAGIPLAVIADTPLYGIDLPDCLARARDLQRCAVAADMFLGQPDPAAEAASAMGTHLINMNDRICGSTWCPPVIGGILVWRDTNHLSSTFVRTLAPVLSERLFSALGFGHHAQEADDI